MSTDEVVGYRFSKEDQALWRAWAAACDFDESQRLSSAYKPSTKDLAVFFDTCTDNGEWWQKRRRNPLPAPKPPPPDDPAWRWARVMLSRRWCTLYELENHLMCPNRRQVRPLLVSLLLRQLETLAIMPRIRCLVEFLTFLSGPGNLGRDQGDGCRRAQLLEHQYTLSPARRDNGRATLP